MARADLLVNLVRAGSRGDRQLFTRTVAALVAEERAKNHHVLADRLARHLEDEQRGIKAVHELRGQALDDEVGSLLAQVETRRTLDDLILPDGALSACRELVEEQHRCDLLRSHSLEPRHRVLLAGPPGNGKTSIAEALAEELMVPLYVVRYAGLIGSYLGETTQRLRKVFDFARSRRCVLFFDEFDTVGKERGDEHETGEIKRVVSTLLLQIDDLPSHVVVVTATNHPELLDRAVWRRFELRLDLPAPSRAQLTRWFDVFAEQVGASLGYSARTLADHLHGASFAEAEAFGLDIRRRWVLSLPDADLKAITCERLEHWRARFRVGEERRADGG